VIVEAMYDKVNLEKSILKDQVLFQTDNNNNNNNQFFFI
jgi:hypothetical protein